jgi:hypothetical protein
MADAIPVRLAHPADAAAGKSAAPVPGVPASGAFPVHHRLPAAAQSAVTADELGPYTPDAVLSAARSTGAAAAAQSASRAAGDDPPAVREASRWLQEPAAALALVEFPALPRPSLPARVAQAEPVAAELRSVEPGVVAV